MERRKFIKNTILTSAGLIAATYIYKAYGEGYGDDAPAFLFANPPDSARPWVFYMWMNGNITKEGITLDLEAMKRMNIGGFVNFNSAVGIPRGPVDYAGSVWADAVVHTASECNRLGIDMFMHNSPGYSGCGGPWITPEYSMQELVWTEALVNNTTGIIDIKLDKPYAKQSYYRDAVTIGYPSLVVEKVLMKDKLIKATVNGGVVDTLLICDGNPETKIRLEASKLAIGTLLLEFSEPFEARAISILRKPEIPEDLFDGPRDHPPHILLESSDDGVQFNPIGQIACVELRAMDTPSTLSFKPVKASYYRLTTTSSTWISDVQLHNGPRLAGWAGKTSFTHGNSFGDTPSVESSLVIDPLSVVNLSEHMDKGGRLVWRAPAGNWTILRIGHTTTGEENAAHPDSAKGLETDKYSRAALDQHFEHFLDPLLKMLQPQIGKGMKGITVDSWEAGKSNWTINFMEEFKKRRGYEMLPWLAAMTGRIISSIDDSERFLWDVRKTHADLLAENFYGYYQEKCHQRSLQFNAEPYGDGVFDSVQVGQYLDTPMSEFWTRYIYGSDATSKQAASIAHVYGRKVAAAEAFTSMPLNAKWADYPYSLKTEGDYFFTRGINRLVFHTFVHQPYKTGKPGMTMGPFGSHFDRNNTWTEQAYGWTGYIKRMQYLLQQGLFVVDACYFKGDEPESGVPDTYEFMPYGYVADVVGAEGLNRFFIKNNQIILPDGMTYKVCILGKSEHILPATLQKLMALVNAGMVMLVLDRPSKTYGHQESDQFIQQKVNELYGGIDGKSVMENTYGNGKVIWVEDMKTALQLLPIHPDFQYTAQNTDAAIYYIHKQLNGADFYFISNHHRRYEKIVCSFRISGMQPEIWNSETNEIYEAAVYAFNGNRTTLSLELGPAGSLFVIFRKKAGQTGYSSITMDGSPYLSLEAYPSCVNGAYPGITNNFSITLWAKPDVFTQESRGMLFHAPQAEKLYGPGHVAVALGAGQNGVQVYERGSGKNRLVLNDTQLLQGYTFIAVVYDQGQPNLYINGKLIASGKVSGNIVHPGLGTAAEESHIATGFEGNYTAPQLFSEVLTAHQITKQYEAGLPAPLQPVAVSVKQLANNKLELTAFKNGKYTFIGPCKSKEILINTCSTTELSNNWVVDLPGNRESPSRIKLPKLLSLSKHPDPDVRYFSGTAVYHQSFVITEADMHPGYQILLDLGRVEVIAEVKVNGTLLGNLWKEPFCINITPVLKPGINHMEISVTTLWPNRLIGDEQLPQENDYNVQGYVERLPDWYVQNEPKPGQRHTFATWKYFDKDSPLLESGLLGPVRLMTAVKKMI
ncbi:glycosyl hydrolase [Mucilaginibacter sp. L196]|uniref:glycosyl hydrolase n=1 Tax=Mucilaginibacter sp. L196 TaxID=1641870 RepID=UPI00131E0A5E|nr:glycosyl hydrolase [Mucilaginibacter sp. L196]